jgi:hypothetical protein
MGITSIVVYPLTHDVWGTVHITLDFSRVKQLFRLPRQRYKRRDGHAKMGMCTLDLSIFIKHIFNLVH